MVSVSLQHKHNANGTAELYDAQPRPYSPTTFDTLPDRHICDAICVHFGTDPVTYAEHTLNTYILEFVSNLRMYIDMRKDSPN